MKKRPAIIFAAFAAFILLIAPISTGYAQDEELLSEFMKATDTRDTMKLKELVEANKDAVPRIIKTIIYKTYSPSTEADVKEYLFYVGETVARTYNEVTGDLEPLIEIKKVSFESHLSKPVRPEPVDGVYIIETPPPSGDRKNVFVPDNIIIKKGSTVRWVNTDNISHVFASMSYIGKGGLYVPNLKPGETFEMTFNEPGEYYYICYIHKGMIGKITVEE